jgi:hypothetical protein
MLASPHFGLSSTALISSMALGGGEHSHVGRLAIQLERYSLMRFSFPRCSFRPDVRLLQPRGPVNLGHHLKRAGGIMAAGSYNDVCASFIRDIYHEFSTDNLSQNALRHYLRAFYSGRTTRDRVDSEPRDRDEHRRINTAWAES